MFETIIWVLSALGMVSIIAGPWVHLIQLSRIDQRLRDLEYAVDGLYADGGGDDPDEIDVEPVVSNVVAIGRAA